MVLEAQKHGCVREAMIITSALSIQDPRERPVDKQQASDEKHRAFMIRSPIFWRLLTCGITSASNKRPCRRINSAVCVAPTYLNYLRVRECRISIPNCVRW
ncbi:ATP-dependent RNA helicase HrpA [Salmonella enterica subsp. enterica]|uniref:ATP-dependent RNA helicase HrpA n=1 Tax=Salmonella enterica I TaxID=59201 RepID=A0A379WU14_SALET|nr:ATP-dependent RNA helicase HrpA [Salmonella enterica subsp. enterica]